jgi:hypothetical protein
MGHQRHTQARPECVTRLLSTPHLDWGPALGLTLGDSHTDAYTFVCWLVICSRSSPKVGLDAVVTY